MPKCYLCGYNYEEKVKYCAQCGVRLNERGAPPRLTTKANAPTEELLELSRMLSSTLDLHLLLKKIDDSAVKLTGAAAGAIMLFDEDRKSLLFRSLSGEKSAVIKPLAVKDGIAWWVAQNGKVVRVDNVANDERFKGSIDKISGFETKSVLCVPVILDDEIIGSLEVLNKTNGTGFTNDDEQLLSVLASQAAVAVKNTRLATEQRNFFTHVIEMLVTAIESTLLVPEGHCWKIAKSAVAIGRKLGIKDNELQDLYYAAALHDLGVLSLRQIVLEIEYRMKLHPVLGADMVKSINMLRDTEPMIRHHHEYFNGSGYPEGLKGEAIPIGARIIAVVEAYEEYLPEYESQSLAKSEIQENSGKLFDPVVVDIFLELMAVYGED